MSLRNIHRSGPLGAFLFAASTAVAASTFADQTSHQLSVVLAYDVDAALHGCPSESEFRDSIIKQLGYDPFRTEAAHHVVAEVKDSEGGVEGRIAWTDAVGNKEGERHLVSTRRDCGEFIRGMTFAIAVQIQILNSSGTASPTGAITTPAAEAPVATAIPKPSVPVPPAAAAKERLSLGIGPTADLGGAPSWSGGGRLFGALRYNMLSLELGAELTLPVTLRRPDGTGFSTTTFGATLAPCLHRDRFALCGVGSLGLLHVQGFGVDDAHSPSSPAGKAGLRLAFDEPLSQRWTIAGHVDGLATLTPRTVYLNAMPVWTTPPLALIVGLDLAVLVR
jgi:hypothetical protein